VPAEGIRDIARGEDASDRTIGRVGWTELADFRQRPAVARLKHGRVIEKSGSPLRNATFRRVWMGATVSAAGDAASRVAVVAYALGSRAAAWRPSPCSRR